MDNRPDVPYEEILEKWRQDPEFLAAYEALEPAFQVACRRIEQGLTQAELAARVGTTQSSISRLESGGQEPSLAFLKRIATAMHCRVEVRLVPLDNNTDSAAAS